MELAQQYHETAAVLLARTFLGLLFLFQGYDAVFNIRVRHVITAYKGSFQNRNMPGFLVSAGAWYTSLTELICGPLLILGLFQHISLFLLGLNVIVVSIALGIQTPLWDMRHAFPRFVLIIFLLCVPAEWNTWSLDQFLFNR